MALPNHCIAPWLPAFCLAVGSLLACAWLEASPAPSSVAVALVFPPWWSAGQDYLAAAAAGRVIRFGLFQNIVVVAPLPGEETLAATGAWVALDPGHLGGCAPTPPLELSDE